MKKAISAIAMGVALVGAPSLAQAQAADDKGIYIGGSVGQMEADGNCPAGFACDLKDTGWKLFAGYRFNRNLAIEGTFAKFGEVTVTSGATTATGELESFGAAVVGILPLGERFELFGKAGIVQTDQNFRVSGPGVVASIGNDGTEFHFGVGATFKLTKNFGIRAEWERLNDSEVNFMSVGVQYKF